MEQPTNFFGGGFRIKGNIQLTGNIIQEPIRIGENAKTLDNTIAIGKTATATGGESVSIGKNSDALKQHSTAFGEEAQALAQDTTAIGNETTAPANWNTVVGYDAGSLQNGENVVLIGRKSEGQGNDVVSIGENARANGNQATAVGKATSALGDNSSVFGQGSSATSSGTTVVGQNVTVNAQDATSIGTNVSVSGKSATGVGNGVIASGQKSTALGNGAEATGLNSLAIGTDSTANRDNTFSFGDRNINLPISKSLLYPTNAGIQTLANLPVDDTVSEGVRQEYSFDIGGESIFIVRAEANGSGGIKNITGRLNGSFSLQGAKNQVEDVITGDISIQDGSGTEQIGLDATVSPVKIDLHNNPIRNFRLRNGNDISYQDDPNTQSFIDFNVTSSSPVNTEHSYSFDAGGVPIFKIFSESNGSGGTKNHEFRAIEQFNVNGNTILDDNTSTTIYDSSNNYIPRSTLEFTEISVNGSNGLDGGSAALGNSLDISISGNLSLDSDLEAIDGETIWSESNTHIPESALQTLSNSALEFTDVSINGSNGLSGGTASLGGSTTVGISGSLNLDSDLQAVDGETIWDESNTHVPESALQTLSNSALTNSSITISTGEDISGGGSVSLGSNISINHANTSGQGNVTTNGATVIDDISLDGNGHVTNLNTQNRSLDDWANPNSRLNLDGNGINFDDPRNSSGASGAINVGFIDFQNEEWSDTSQNQSTMAYDASEGFLFNDNIELSGSLNEGAAL